MKTIGIIGGMGPMATVDIFQKIIEATKAREDQEHIHILIDNNTEIPDRTACIEGRGASPVPEIANSAERLLKAGADFLVMGCNTAHYFWPQVEEELKRRGIEKAPFLSMIEAAADFTQERGLKCVGLLASAGTCKVGLYQNALAARGIKVLQPAGAQEEAIHGMIYNGVKAGDYGYDTTAAKKVLAELTAAGAEAFVLGCTEVPVAVSMYHLEGDFVDATQVLSEKAVKEAGAEVVSKL